MAIIKCDGKKMVVTLDDGRTATRATKNIYHAAVVGIRDGKLRILSAHNTEAKARETFQATKAGKWISTQYNHATDLELVVESGNFEPVSPEEQEAIIAAECKAIAEGRPARRKL